MPISTLPDDYWQHDAREQTLTGRRTRQVFRLAQEVEVRLAEASPVTGGLVFHVVPETCNSQGNGPAAGDPPRRPADLLLIVPVHAQPAGNAGFDPAMVANVYTVALAFMEPRTLDPVPVPVLTIWGLRGLTALDPNLLATESGGKLVLTEGQHLLAAAAGAGERRTRCLGGGRGAAFRGGGDRVAGGAAGRHAGHHPELL